MNLRKGGKRLSEADYQSAKEDFLKKLEAVTLFSETDDSKEERIAKGRDDAFYFAKTYLGHYFTTKTQAEWHPDCVAACAIEEVPVTITGPRGGAKSTIVSFLEFIRDICYQREDFIVLVMASIDRAELYTLRILTELQHNPRIKEDFGALVSMNAAAGNFATKRTRTRERSTRLMAWGDGMSMRGLVSEFSRPTKIVCEDLQDIDSAESEKRTNKVLYKIKADWKGATAVRHWKFIVVANVMVEGSHLDRLRKEEKGWRHFTFLPEVTDAFGNRRATWPEHATLEQLDAQRIQDGDDVYEAEQLCEPRERGTDFKPEWFRHWDALPVYNRKRVVLVLDPALSGFSDNTACAAMVRWRRSMKDADYMTLRDGKGHLYEEGLYDLILRISNRQQSLDEMFEMLYEWDTIFGRPLIYYDGSFGQKTVMRKFAGQWAVKKKRRLRMRHYILKRDKIRRIKAIQPDIQSGHVLFPPKAGVQEPDVKETIRQFVRLGKTGMKDDGPDAIAAGIEQADKRSKASG